MRDKDMTLVWINKDILGVYADLNRSLQGSCALIKHIKIPLAFGNIVFVYLATINNIYSLDLRINGDATQVFTDADLLRYRLLETIKYIEFTGVLQIGDEV